VKQWITDRIGDLVDGKTASPEKTFAFWWMRNSGGGEDFTRDDAVIEVLHDFMAISQWGNMIYEIMRRLAAASGDPEIRAEFKKTMDSDTEDAPTGIFTPLTRFVMELFRIMRRLAAASGDPEIRAEFKKTMDSDTEDAPTGTFTPLTRFVMELFRTISPNHGSLSALEATGSRPDQTFN
jgi:hypothetical protein